MNARDADIYVTVAEARIAKLREENARLRKALERIRAVVAGPDQCWVHPQYGSLTTAAEHEIVRLVDLALKAPESDH